MKKGKPTPDLIQDTTSQTFQAPQVEASLSKLHQIEVTPTPALANSMYISAFSPVQLAPCRAVALAKADLQIFDPQTPRVLTIFEDF